MHSKLIILIFLTLIFSSCQNKRSSIPSTTSPQASGISTPITNSSDWKALKYALELDFGSPTEFNSSNQNLAQKYGLTSWNAETIVQKIAALGFQSLTFPAKTIDGFALYNNAQSNFNIVKASPQGKNLLKEISDACKTSGIQFGITYSLVDRNFNGMVWSDHYADRIPQELMPKILVELEDLLTQYGSLHHIQFKYGSLSSAQSDSIYSKVKALQPDCLINGLLTANNDYQLIADENFEDYQFELPWRCLAQLNSEGQSVSPDQIAQRKLHRLLQIISKGGQYTLVAQLNQKGQFSAQNQQVLESMSAWLDEKREFVYETEPSPFGIRSWGAVTKAEAKSKLYLYILDWPEDNQINLYGLNNSLFGLFSTHEPNILVPYNKQSRNLVINLGGDIEKKLGTGILALEYTGILDITPLKMAYGRGGSWELTNKNAVNVKTIDFRNQYATAPSNHQYIWNLPPTTGGAYALKCKFTRQEIGQELVLQVGGQTYDLTLDNAQQEERPDPQEIIYGLFYQGDPSLQNQPFTKRHGSTKGFSRTEKWGFNGEVDWIERENWNQGETWSIDAAPMSSTYIYQSMYSQADQIMVSAFTADDGVSVWSDGNLVTEVLSFDDRGQTLIEIPLKSGNNQLMYRFFNNHDEHKIGIQHDVLAAQYVKALANPIQLQANTITEIKLLRKDQSSLPLYLTNFSIEITPVQQM